MIAGPAFHYDFLFGIELDSIPALPVLYSKKAVFPSAEREVRHGSRDADVDAYIPCGRIVTKLARSRAAGCEDRSGIAIGTGSQYLDGFVEGFSGDESSSKAISRAQAPDAICELGRAM